MTAGIHFLKPYTTAAVRIIKQEVRSVELGVCQMQLFHYHVTFIRFKICCCVQTFMKIG